MKRSRFTEEQIIGILREQETGASVLDLCRRDGLSSAMPFYAHPNAPTVLPPLPHKHQLADQSVNG